MKIQIAAFAIVVLALALALTTSAQTICDFSGGGGGNALMGCLNTGLCAHDNSSAQNNYCLAVQGGASYCTTAAAVAGAPPNQYQYNAPVNDGTCNKGSLSLNSGGTNQYGRWTCNADAACANSTNGIYCVQHLPTIYPNSGYRICQTTPASKRSINAVALMDLTHQAWLDNLVQCNDVGCRISSGSKRDAQVDALAQIALANQFLVLCDAEGCLIHYHE